MGVCISRRLKEELEINSFGLLVIMYNVSYATKELKSKAVLSRKQFCMICIATLING